MLIGGGIVYGKLVQKGNNTEKDVVSIKSDVRALKTWGEIEIAKAIADRNDNFIRKDVFNECIADVKRRLDDVNTIEINSRLSRIEAMLDQIQITLAERK